MLNKIVGYFVGINLTVAVAAAMFSFSNIESGKVDSETIYSFLEFTSKEIFKKNDYFPHSLEEKSIEIELPEAKHEEVKIKKPRKSDQEIWTWGKFEKALVLVQKWGQWSLKLFFSYDEYEKWKKIEKVKTPLNYQNLWNEILHVAFPIPKHATLAELLGGLKPKVYSKYELSAEIKSKSWNFRMYLGKDNHERLMRFLEKYGTSKK